MGTLPTPLSALLTVLGAIAVATISAAITIWQVLRHERQQRQTEREARAVQMEQSHSQDIWQFVEQLQEELHAARLEIKSQAAQIGALTSELATTRANEALLKVKNSELTQRVEALEASRGGVP